MPHLPPFDPGPVTSIEIYKRDVVVRRQGRLHPGNRGEAPERGVITMLSRKSRQRLAFIANNTRVVFHTMVTLTYPREYPSDGKKVKAHLNTFLTWCRRRFDRPSYIWFLEFQRRGAPHIHLVFDWSLPQTIAEKKEAYQEIAQKWYSIVKSGDKRHLAAGTRTERIRKPDGAARYCLKYAYKMRQKSVPESYRNIGRCWGGSRDVTPKRYRTVMIDELSVRAIIADWEYSPNEDTLVYQTLFGCAERFETFLGIGADDDLTKTPFECMLLPSKSDENELIANRVKGECK